MSTEPMLSVIMPVFNEERTIVRALEAVNEVPFHKEILVVDDGSTDGTSTLVKALCNDAVYHNVVCLFSEVNSGKGAAVRKAICQARGDVVLIQDADLEYSPKDYPLLLRPLMSGEADLVLGSRFLKGNPWSHPIHYLCNRILNCCFSFAVGKRVTDVETGLKAFRREIVAEIPLVEDRFGFEIEVVARCIKAGCRVQEVPVSYRRRGYVDGKKCTLRYQIQAIPQLLRYTLRL